MLALLLLTREMPGYSGTPLVRKLGIKAGERLVAINPPARYEQLLEGLPDDVSIGSQIAANARFLHLFVRERVDLEERLSNLRTKLDDAGVLWVSWPNKSSGSGLKLMIRRENRAGKTK